MMKPLESFNLARVCASLSMIAADQSHNANDREVAGDALSILDGFILPLTAARRISEAIRCAVDEDGEPLGMVTVRTDDLRMLLGWKAA